MNSTCLALASDDGCIELEIEIESIPSVGQDIR